MPRLAAWQLLRSGSPTPMREVDRIARARELAPRDRALLRQLVGTEVRRRGTLRALVRHFMLRKPSPDLAAHLHLGLVQCFFLDRIPDHAAVNETLGAVGESLGPSKVRVVNGVLRTALRARREGTSGDPRRDFVGRDLHLDAPFLHDPQEHPHLWAEDAFSLPAPLHKRWAKRFGDEVAKGLALYALREPPTSLRAVHAEERDALVQALTAAGASARPGRHPAVLLVPATETEAAVTSEPFGAGRLTVQGEAALLAAEALEAAPGEQVLELCAAPGGKTAVLAQAGAQVVACDLNGERLARVHEGLGRLGLSERVRTLASDGTAVLEPDLSFDGVLIDAPCSNTAVLAARPEARWRFGPSGQRQLTTLQARLLSEGAARVRPGGRLVWSVCSLEPDEGRQQVKRFVEGNPGWGVELECETLPDVATDATSGAGPVDGGYFARLRKA